MTVVLDLDQEQEQWLRGAAAARGVDADTLANEILRKGLREFAEPASVPATDHEKGSGRLLGLNAMGVTWVSEDFDAPLPDSFWLGTE